MKKKFDWFGIRYLFDLVKKFNISFDFLKRLTFYMDIHQAETVLGEVSEASSQKKKEAIENLLKAAQALARVNPDPQKTSDLLIWIAKTTREGTPEALEELSKPEAARALQQLIF